MAVNILDRVVTLSKFRGALVGVLVGDCLGAPYEGDAKVSKVVLQKYFDKLEDPTFKSPLKKFSDDTVMTKAAAESLILHNTLNEVDIAKRFVMNFFSEPDRGYGEGVITVFKKLRVNKFSDILTPAREQFGGSGSLGNGGAMRITPIALFCCSDYKLLLDFSSRCTKITHTHRLGVQGALLQAVALYECFHHDPSERLNIQSFINKLINKMAEIEAMETDEIQFEDSRKRQSYQQQLKVIENLLQLKDPSDREVLELLGNSVEAFFSVPTAIYCFLRAQKPIHAIEDTQTPQFKTNLYSIKTDNIFRRTVQYAISLGGDTDTIASMAGALAGAYFGYDYINKGIQNQCEGLNEILKLAKDLHSNTVFLTSPS